MMPRRAALRLAIVTALLVFASSAAASWLSGGPGSGYSRATTMPSGNTPTASVSGRNVTVSWTASGGTVPVTGYLVKRYDQSGQVQTIGSGCSGTTAGLTCTETGVPPGQWRYTVTPVRGNWRGAESSQSAAVTVAGPNLTLSPTTVTSLPATLSGQITGYIEGETVTFRLDDPQSGQTLSGSITPSPVPANGTATVSVELPAGVSNGQHTVYAIGNQGDSAGASVTVAVPTFVNNVGQASCGSGTSLSVVVPSAGVAAGDTLIVRLDLRSTGTTAVSASDSKGNAYTVDANSIHESGLQRSTIFSAYIATALVSGNTITVSFPFAASSAVVVDEFSGIAQTGRLDASGTRNGQNSTPSVSVTTTRADDVVVGAVSAATNTTFTQPAGWTPLTSQSVSCGGAPGDSLNLGAYQIPSSTGTYSYNPTLSSSQRWAAAAVAYMPG